MDAFYLDDYFATPAVAPSYRINRNLLAMASSAVVEGPYEKTAIVPAGGGDPSMGGAPPQGAPPDPSMGGAPPAPDPSAGGGAPPAPAPIDPSLVQAVAQAVMQQLGGGAMGGAGGGMGGMGDMMGKPKKVDPAIIDAKLYDIDKKLSLVCDQMGITIPASQTIGLPPDPMAAQAASQDSQDVSAAMGGGQPAAPQGQGIQPMSGMDASGPIGGAKMGAFGDVWPIDRPSLLPESTTASPAQRFRQLLGA